jgi:pyrimidine operon attenuation protein/uracil phosphoribosyltransferase
LQTIYPLHPLSIHVAVLIDRTHKKFPIKADIIGLDLATTMTNHIHVVFDENGAPEGAYVY